MDDTPRDLSVSCEGGPSSTPPRAFAQGTGLMLQILGCVLFLSMGCACLTSGLWDPARSRGEVLSQLEQKRQHQELTGHGSDHHRPGFARNGTMLMVMFTAVGGVAMAGFGLGLQSDKPRAAWGAVGTNAILAGALLIAGAQLWWGQAPVLIQIFNTLLALLAMILMIFCIVALKQVRAHPPPPDLDILPSDFVIEDPWHRRHSTHAQNAER